MKTTQSELLEIIQRKRKKEEVEDKKKLREEVNSHYEAFLKAGGEVKKVDSRIMMSANTAPTKDDYKRGRKLLAQKRAKEQAMKTKPTETETERGTENGTHA